MKTFLVCSGLLLIAFAGYVYKTNPVGCAKLGHDFLTLIISLSSVQPPQRAQQEAEAVTETAARPAPQVVTPPSAPADTAAAPAPTPAPAGPASPPAPVAPATLPPPMAPMVASIDQTDPLQAAPNFQAALHEARTSNKLVMLNFQGSDWSPNCRSLDKEVFSSDSFRSYLIPHFVLMNIDFPRDLALSEEQKKENETLAKRYQVAGYPTLVVVDSVGVEVGRIKDYSPGSGPDAVIANLQTYCKF